MKPELFYRTTEPEKVLHVSTITDGLREMRMTHSEAVDYHSYRLREVAYKLGEQIVATALKAGGKFVIELREESLQDFALYGHPSASLRRRTTVVMTPVERVSV